MATIVRVPDAAAPSPLLADVAALFLEYRDTLLAHDVPIDVFQNFGAEIEALPHVYVAASRGCILLAFLNGAPVGCIALKEVRGGTALSDDLGDGIGHNVGEVKRLFVRPTARRKGVAALLSSALEDVARGFDYSALVLDTLARLPGALPLYAQLGYRACADYNGNPMKDASFLIKHLPQCTTAG